jgi:hypothetical protein
MKLPIVERGVPSALFVSTTNKDGNYELARGTNGTASLIRSVARVVCEQMIEDSRVYLDDLIVCDDHKGAKKTTFELVGPINLFSEVVKTSRISAFNGELLGSEGNFFGNIYESGLVITPFSAIHLGRSIKAVISVRDRQTPVYGDDVSKSLFALTEGRGDAGVLMAAMVDEMSHRIGCCIDLGTVDVDGQAMYISVGMNLLESKSKPKPNKEPFSIKRKAVPRSQPTSPLPFWPPSTGE